MPCITLIPDAMLKNAYSLLWQPGETLHSTWWALWDMEALFDIYPRLSLCGRREIDRQIHARRGLLEWKPAHLSEAQQQLILLQPRLPLLLTALGLLALKCSGYLWLRPYRQVLREIFSEQQFVQLAALLGEGGLRVKYQPEELLTVSQNIGRELVSRTLRQEPLWRLLEFTLPYQAELGTDITLDEPLAALLRLERFL